MKRMMACLMALGGLLAVSSPAGAAAEKVKPYPHYWMSVATSNQSIPGMSSEMPGIAGLFGVKSGFGPKRDLLLQLESPRQASGEPAASEAIPHVAEADGYRFDVVNLARHVENVRTFGVPAVVAINRFSADTDLELATVRQACAELGVEAIECTHWADGSAGSSG